MAASSIAKTTIMDNTPKTELASRLLRHSYPHTDIYHGTSEDLIAADLVADGMFPGDPGRNKSQKTYQGPPRVRIIKQSKNSFEVWFYQSAEEEERREEIEARNRTRQKIVEEMQKDIDVVLHFQSAQAFRAHMVKYVKTDLLMIRQRLESRGFGYHFDQDTMIQLDEAIDEIIQALQNGAVQFDRVKRERVIEMVKQKAAQSDGQFQSFLAGVTVTKRSPRQNRNAAQ